MGMVLSHTPPAERPAEDGPPADDSLADVRAALRGLQFGSVQIIVQDGVIVQIDRTEKRRVQRALPRKRP